MKKQYRIKKYSEIDAIFKGKNIKSDGYFSIYIAYGNHETHFRFAISIGRKYGGAVARNKIKRQIRMIIHNNHDNIKDRMLFVVVVKPKASQLNYQEIKQSITSLLQKSKLLENLHA